MLEGIEWLKANVRQGLVNDSRILSYVIPEDEQIGNDFEHLPQLPLTTEKKFWAFESYLGIKTNNRTVVGLTI